jgi:hypothetical protein
MAEGLSLRHGHWGHRWRNQSVEPPAGEVTDEGQAAIELELRAEDATTSFA